MLILEAYMRNLTPGSFHEWETRQKWSSPYSPTVYPQGLSWAAGFHVLVIVLIRMGSQCNFQGS